MKAMSGKVVSTGKMKDTIVVEVQRTRLHPLYKKYLKKTKRYKVHSVKDGIKTGDTVEIIQTKPISKEKHYKIK